MKSTGSSPRPRVASTVFQTLLGGAALALVLGLAIAACEDDSGGSNPSPDAAADASANG